MIDKKIKVAYFGSPVFSAIFLENIIKEQINLPIEIKCIFTQPDRPVGRKKLLTPTAVKNIGNTYKINTFDIQPSKNRLSQIKNIFKEHEIELCLVFAYGNIIQEALLNTPIFGFWNIHLSLLPKYRGPSPVAYPILFGEKETGTTIMKMDKYIDHGNILAIKKTSIEKDEKHQDLINRLTNQAFTLFTRYIKENEKSLLRRKIKESNLVGTVQDHKNATFTKLLTKNDAFIDINFLKAGIFGEKLNEKYLPKVFVDYLIKNNLYKKQNPLKLQYSAKLIFNMYKGLYGWPGLWTLISINNQKKRMLIKDLDLKDNKIYLKTIQIEGKKAISFFEFNQLHSIVTI